jgi:hypothetical protein
MNQNTTLRCLKFGSALTIFFGILVAAAATPIWRRNGGLGRTSLDVIHTAVSERSKASGQTNHSQYRHVVCYRQRGLDNRRRTS